MNSILLAPPEGVVRQAVDAFWETFPPFWHRVRATIRQSATEQFEISVEQFHILRHIRRGDQSVSLLAEAKNISRAAISQSVNALVNKGLITRTTDSDDRRHVVLSLTESGNTLLDDIFNHTRQWMMQAFSQLNEQELHTLIQAMAALKKLDLE
jgi:DNA-binding MarR family transcriptional regulator